MPVSLFGAESKLELGFPPPQKKKKEAGEEEKKPPAVDLRKLELNLLLPEGDLRVPFAEGGNSQDGGEKFTGIISRWCRQPRQDRSYRMKICFSALTEKSKSFRQGSSSKLGTAIGRGTGLR